MEELQNQTVTHPPSLPENQTATPSQPVLRRSYTRLFSDRMNRRNYLVGLIATKLAQLHALDIPIRKQKFILFDFSHDAYSHKNSFQSKIEVAKIY